MSLKCFNCLFYLYFVGYEFQLSLNLETRQVIYTPPEDVGNVYYDKLPDSLKQSKIYSVDNASSFIREIHEQLSNDHSAK